MLTHKKKISKKVILIVSFLIASVGVALIALTRAADPTDTTTANVWVDTNGGSCTRQPSPVSYTVGNAQSCSSLNAAYLAASPGDSVLVASETYTDQYIGWKNNATAPDITMQPASNASVIIKELDIQGTRYLTLKNFRIEPMAGRAGWDQIIDFGQDIQPEPPSYVTLDGITMDGRVNGQNQERTGLGINGGAKYITIKNSDLGFIQDQKVIQVQNYQSKGYNDHITIDNVKLHDDPQTSPDKHLECLWASSMSNSTLSRLDFYNCALPMIISHFGTDLPLQNVTIEKSVFEASGWSGGQPGYYSIDGCLSTAGSPGSLNLKYNYFAIPWGCAIEGGYSGLTAVGNIGPETACRPGVTYRFNVWNGAKCDATDKQSAGATSQVVRVGLAFNGGPGDYCPLSPNSPQIDSGSLSDYPIIDFLGRSRYSGSAPDAGPCEYGSGPPSSGKTGDINNDNSINIFDLSIILSNYGKTTAQASNPSADINNSGSIDGTDLSILLSNYGT